MKEQLNAEQSSQNNFWSLAVDIRHPEKQPIVFEGREKNLFFFSFFFFFFSFSSFFLFSFLLLVFLSYFLLNSSNTPLLFLNFHFTITLQKKKKGERSPIFKLNFIYISKFWVFVFVFKYLISKSLTSTLNFLIFVFQYVI